MSVQCVYTDLPAVHVVQRAIYVLANLEMPLPRHPTVVSVYGNIPPDFQLLVSPPFIKTVCILFVMLPVSSLKNIASLEKVTTVRVRGPLYRVLC